MDCVSLGIHFLSIFLLFAPESTNFEALLQNVLTGTKINNHSVQNLKSIYMTLYFMHYINMMRNLYINSTFSSLLISIKLINSN